MPALSFLSLFSTVAWSVAAAPLTNTGNTGNATTTRISWGPCDKNEVNATVPIYCASLPVPLDYSNPTSNVTLDLQLARVPALIQPSRGSIQFNTGGPGEPGRSQLALFADTLLRLTGGEWDLVIFDPRGTADTLPFTCYNTSLTEIEYLDAQILSSSSNVAVGQLWARGAIDSNNCAANNKETGELIGTAFTARDLISVAEALDDDGLLRYWGLSYGTTLGATVASMFPDRIDKMILDGVQNPHEYYHGLMDYEEWLVADEEFSAVFSTCITAGPERCALAGRNTTAAELEAAVWARLDELKYQPIAVGNLLFDYDMLKGLFELSTYTYVFWPALTEILSMMLSNKIDNSKFLGLLATVGGAQTIDSKAATLQSLLGIHCGDRDTRVSSLQAFMPAVQKVTNISRVMGEAEIGPMSACAQWKIDAKERYQGDFQVRTRNPVLLIGNTFDGHTPLKSAYNVSSGFEGSTVLEVNGYAHTSIALPSACLLRTTSAYWINGTLPEYGAVCEVEGRPFTNTSWSDVFASVGL